MNLARQKKLIKISETLITPMSVRQAAEHIGNMSVESVYANIKLLIGLNYVIQEGVTLHNAYPVKTYKAVKLWQIDKALLPAIERNIPIDEKVPAKAEYINGVLIHRMDKHGKHNLQSKPKIKYGVSGSSLSDAF